MQCEAKTGKIQQRGRVGQKGPSADVKPYLVVLIKKISGMKSAISVVQGLELAYSVI